MRIRKRERGLERSRLTARVSSPHLRAPAPVGALARNDAVDHVDLKLELRGGKGGSGWGRGSEDGRGWWSVQPSAS